jgi:hypothetical protein
VDLTWSAPNVGTVDHYTVWRGMCPNTPTPCTLANSSPAQLAPIVSPTAVCDTSFIYCDKLPISIDDNHFLYYVTATYVDSNHVSTMSGPSNQVIGSEATIPAPSDLRATGITDGVTAVQISRSRGTGLKKIGAICGFRIGSGVEVGLSAVQVS